MSNEWKPKCNKCGKDIPIGLQLDKICVECLLKTPNKDG